MEPVGERRLIGAHLLDELAQRVPGCLLDELEVVRFLAVVHEYQRDDAALQTGGDVERVMTGRWLGCGDRVDRDRDRLGAAGCSEEREQSDGCDERARTHDEAPFRGCPTA